MGAWELLPHLLQELLPLFVKVRIVMLRCVWTNLTRQGRWWYAHFVGLQVLLILCKPRVHGQFDIPPCLEDLLVITEVDVLSSKQSLIIIYRLIWNMKGALIATVYALNGVVKLAIIHEFLFLVLGQTLLIMDNIVSYKFFVVWVALKRCSLDNIDATKRIVCIIQRLFQVVFVCRKYFYTRLLILWQALIKLELFGTSRPDILFPYSVSSIFDGRMSWLVGAIEELVVLQANFQSNSQGVKPVPGDLRILLLGILGCKVIFTLHLCNWGLIYIRGIVIFGIYVFNMEAIALRIVAHCSWGIGPLLAARIEWDYFWLLALVFALGFNFSRFLLVCCSFICHLLLLDALWIFV